MTNMVKELQDLKSQKLPYFLVLNTLHFNLRQLRQKRGRQRPLRQSQLVKQIKS